jgi:hypothetical protein
MTIGDLYDAAFGVVCPDPDVAAVPANSDTGRACQRRINTATGHVRVLMRNYGTGSDVVKGVLALVVIDLQGILHG